MERSPIPSLRRAVPASASSLDCRALLDTGEEITCADTMLIQQLGLPLAQVTLANVPALGGLQAGADYHCGLTMVHPSGDTSQNLVQSNMIVMEVPLAAIGYQILIGRDLLDLCDFLYSGRRGRFTLAY